MTLHNSTRTGRYAIATLLIVLYLAPVALLYFGIVPYSLRLLFLLVITCLMIAYCIARKFSLTELGITKAFLGKSMLWNGLYSLVSIGIIILCFKTNLLRKAPPVDDRFFFFYYVLLSCPCQEFLYRSIVFAEFRRHTAWMKYFVIISALNYSFLHIFYHDAITLIVTLIAGIVWGIIYKKYPNFWGIALSHAVLGVLSIVTGLI